MDGNIDQYRPAAAIAAIPERTKELMDLTDRGSEDLIEQYRTYLSGDEPISYSAQQAILAVLRELRRVDEASTGELQSVASEDVEEAIASPRTLWDAIGLTFTDLPGIADERA